MKFLKKLLATLTANPLGQSLLEKNVQISQFLMGIGSGAGMGTSGEQAIFKMVRKRCPAPYCIFDVGANQGQFLRLALDQLAGQDLAIHSFEPGAQTFAALVQSLPNSGDIKVNNVGIGEQAGRATLHYDTTGSGLASLTKRRLDHFNIAFEQSESVEITTVDAYCKANSISHIHLLKIDIEGHELDALKGAERMFSTQSIDVVTFEFGGCNIDTRTYFQDFWYFFQRRGFDLFRITPLGYLSPIVAYREMHEQFRTTNFLAVRKAWVATGLAISTG